jgi:hypothetical protein
MNKEIHKLKLRRVSGEPIIYPIIETELLSYGMDESVSEEELLNIKDPHDFIEELDKKEASRVLYDMLDTLREREKKIILCRFVDDLTLEETGKKHHITRERVRQIEAKALRKCRHPSRYNILMNYLECFDSIKSKEEILRKREAERIEREREHKEQEKIWAAQERKRRKERAKIEKERTKQIEERRINREKYWDEQEDNEREDEEREKMAKYVFPYMPGNALTPAHLVNKETERFVGKCSCSEWVKDWPVQFHRNQVYINLFCTLCNSQFIMRSKRAYTPKEIHENN